MDYQLKVLASQVYGQFHFANNEWDVLYSFSRYDTVYTTL